MCDRRLLFLIMDHCLIFDVAIENIPIDFRWANHSTLSVYQ